MTQCRARWAISHTARTVAAVARVPVGLSGRVSTTAATRVADSAPRTAAASSLLRIGHAALTGQRGHADHGEPEQRRLRGVADPARPAGGRSRRRPRAGARTAAACSPGPATTCAGSVATPRRSPVAGGRGAQVLDADDGPVRRMARCPRQRLDEAGVHGETGLPESERQHRPSGCAPSLGLLIDRQGGGDSHGDPLRRGSPPPSATAGTVYTPSVTSRGPETVASPRGWRRSMKGPDRQPHSETPMARSRFVILAARAVDVAVPRGSVRPP